MATLAKKSPSRDLKKHNGIRACICCYMAGAPSDRVAGLLELWNKKAEWRIRREEGQFGQCPKGKVFFFQRRSPNQLLWLQEHLRFYKQFCLDPRNTLLRIQFVIQYVSKYKHCQRHNGPEGWVHIAKVTSWSHITSSNTNLNHISSSESRLSIN